MANEISVPKRNQTILVQLRGEPNTATDTDWRWGTHDGLSLNPSTGEWYDHSEDTGGRSSLALVQHLTDMERDQAIKFVNNLEVKDHAPSRQWQSVKQNPGLTEAEKIKRANGELWNNARTVFVNALLLNQHFWDVACKTEISGLTPMKNHFAPIPIRC